MRGFLGGVSLGAVVAAGGAAMLSLAVPLPKVVDVAMQTPTETSGPTDATGVVIDTPGSDSDLVEAAPVAPEGGGRVDLDALLNVDTQPLSRPVVGSQETALSDSVAAVTDPATSPDVAMNTDAPVIPVEALPVPVAPSQEGEIVVSSEPAQPPQPVDVPTPPKAGIETPAPDIAVILKAEDVNPSSDHGPEMEASPVTEIAPIAPPTAGAVTAPNVIVEVPSMLAPDSGTMPVGAMPTIVETPAAQTVPGEAPEEATVDVAEDPELSQDGERIAALPTTAVARDGTGGPTIGSPVVPLTERNLTQTPDPSVATPFETYSEPLSNPDARPLMAIVLIDDAQSIGAEALVEFPYPLSFAIDPQDPQAVEKMTARRAAGFEVLVLTDLPREAAPQDAETALAVWFNTLPEAIAVLEGTGTGFHGNRPLADQVAAVAAASGRGFLTQNHGLNTVQKLAARDGVPAAVVFRDFDGAGQNPKAIRRFLDQAAFRAGQEGAVIMLGRVKPDTISALLLWGLQDRAARVALAPVSAALSLQSGGN